MNLSPKKGFLTYFFLQALVLFIFYFPWIFDQASYFYRDLTHYNEPYAAFFRDCVQKFQAPLWNPYCYLGMPQMAISVQGICYPPTWLFAFLSFSSGIACQMFLHQLICGTGAFLLAAALGWGFLPASVCGIVMAMNGYNFCFTSIVSLVESAAWCPASFFALYKLAQNEGDDKQFRDIALWTFISSLLISMQLLAGHPELSSIQFMLIFTFIAISAYKDWRLTGFFPWQQIGFRLRAVFIAVLLAMPMILPAFEWYKLSRRSDGLDPSEALTLSATWYDLITLILPQPLQDMQLRWSEFRPLIMKGQLMPYMASAFVGPVVITLALWSLADKSFKERLLYFGLFLLVVLLALGENTPLAPAILQITKSAIRFPVKLMFFAVACLALMAGRGLYACMQEKTRVFPISLIFWSIGLLLSILLFNGLHLLDFALPLRVLNQPLQMQGVRACQLLIGQSGIYASLIGLFISAAAYFYEKHRSRLKYFPHAIVIAALAALLHYAYSYCRTAAGPDYFQKPSLIANELARLNSEAQAPQASRQLGLYLEHFTVPQAYLGEENIEATTGTYQYSRQMLKPNTNIDFKQASAFGFEGSCKGDYYHFLSNCYGKSSQRLGGSEKTDDTAIARFCQLSSTAYVITQVYRYGTEQVPKVPVAEKAQSMLSVPELDRRFFELVYESRKHNARIYRVLNDLPRAYLSKNWLICRQPEEALTAIYESNQSGADLSRMSFIELKSRNADIPEKVLSGKPMEKLEINQKDPNQLTIEADCDQDCFLVLSDQHYPGWRATVDGKETEIHIANGFTRAVFLPKGKHEISFYYAPISFYGGLLVFVLGLAWLLLIKLQELHATQKLGQNGKNEREEGKTNG